MADSVLKQNYEKQANLIKRKAELERAIADRERIAREQERGKRNIEQCVDKWPCWDLEERREFIRLATDAITLEKLEKGILRLTIIWSPLMGFIWPMESSTRAMTRQSSNSDHCRFLGHTTISTMERLTTTIDPDR
jgi:hypothetical protein